jgi:ribonuclease HI
MKLTLYTDGSCITQTRQGGWAYLCEQTGEANSGSVGDTTVNEMEMEAVWHALESIPDGAEVEVITDSNLVLGWLGKNWAVDANPRIGEIRSEIRTLIPQKGLRLTLRKVKAHNGNSLNEKCDKMAKIAAAKAPLVGETAEAFQWLQFTMTVQDVDVWVIRGIVEYLKKLGGSVTGGEVIAYDGDWKQVAHGEIKNGKVDISR